MIMLVLMLLGFFRVCIPAQPFVHQMIRLDENCEYGKETKWADIFFHDRGYAMCANRNGSVYVTDQIENCVYLFDQKGHLSSTFGRKGQGPGDLVSPLKISIYAGAKLTICEFPLIRTVSVHGLKGNFIAKIRLQHAPKDAWLISDKSVLYMTQGFIGPSDKLNWNFRLLLLNNLQEAGWRVVKELTKKDSTSFYDEKSRMSWPSGISPNLYGEMVVSVNENGQVLVGSTDENRFDFYDPGMANMRRIALPLERRGQAQGYLDETKKNILRNNDRFMLEFLKEPRLIGKFSDLKMDVDYLPYYRMVFLDNHERIWVFLFEPVPSQKKQQVKVFSLSGTLLYQCTLDLRPFSRAIDSIFYPKLFSVSDLGIHALLPTENDVGDSEYRLYAVPIEPVKH